MKFLIDTGATISLLPVCNVPIGVTIQHSDIVIEGISGETQCAVGKVDLKIQPEFSGKVFNVTFHIVPKAVFNLLGLLRGQQPNTSRPVAENVLLR